MRGSLLEKDLKGVEFLIKKGKGQGVKGKTAFFFLPPTTKTREGEGRRRRCLPGGPWATAVAGGWGKKRRGPRWIDSPTYFGWRWPVRAVHGGGRRSPEMVVVEALRVWGGSWR